MPRLRTKPVCWLQSLTGAPPILLGYVLPRMCCKAKANGVEGWYEVHIDGDTDNYNRYRKERAAHYMSTVFDPAPRHEVEEFEKHVDPNYTKEIKKKHRSPALVKVFKP